MTAATFDVDTFLGRYAYVDCRADGHPWPPTQRQDWRIDGSGPQRVYFRPRVCPVCETVRVDRVNARWESLPSVYHYPEGYRCSRDESPKRSEARRYLIQSIFGADAATPARRQRKGKR